MGNEFLLPAFLMHVQPDLLHRFFAIHFGIGLDIPVVDSDDMVPLLHALDRLPPSTRGTAIALFRDMHDLATECGVLSLLDQAKLHPQLVSGYNLSAQFQSLTGFVNKVIWVFLHTPALYDYARRWISADQFVRWERWHRLPKGIPPVTDDRITCLVDAIQQLYAAQGRGESCSIETFSRDGQTLFWGRLRDYAAFDLRIDDAGKLRRDTRHPMIDILWRNGHEEGVLDINTQGTQAMRTALQECFIQTIFEIEPPQQSPLDPPFDLQLLANPGISFPTDPKDGIESVRIKRFTIRCPEWGEQPQVIQTGMTDGQWVSIHERVARHCRITATFWEVLEVLGATLQVKFPGEGCQGLVTFDLMAPNVCTLQSTGRHHLIRQYLYRWGLARA